MTEGDMGRREELFLFLKKMLDQAEAFQYFGEQAITIKFRDGKLCGGFETSSKQTHKFKE